MDRFLFLREAGLLAEAGAVPSRRLLTLLGCSIAAALCAVLLAIPSRWFEVPLERVLYQGSGCLPFDGVCIWTQKSAEFPLRPLDRSRALQCRIEVTTHCPFPDRLPSVSFTVDGESQLTTEVQNQPAVATLRIRASRAADGAEIGINCSKTFVPGGGDTRELGVVLSAVHLRVDETGLSLPRVQLLIAGLILGLAMGAAGMALFGSSSRALLFVTSASGIAGGSLGILSSPLDDPLWTALGVSIAGGAVLWLSSFLQGSWQRRPLEAIVNLTVLLAYLGGILGGYRSGLRTGTGMLGGLWQLIDPVLLRMDFTRSIVYLHAQPPLYNVIAAVIEKGFLCHELACLRFLGVALGLLTGISLLAALSQLKTAIWLRAVLVPLFLISPAVIIHAISADYTLLVSCLNATWALGLIACATSQRRRDAILLCAPLAALCMTRSLYHILWLLLVLTLALLLRLRCGRFLLWCAAACMLLVGSWYVKNRVLYGSLTASTWQGMNMERVIVWWINADPKFQRLVSEKKISPLLMLGPFEALDYYGAYRPVVRPTGVPLLDEPVKSTGALNFHNIAYIDLSRRYSTEIVKLIGAAPELYARGACYGMIHFFQPGSDLPTFGGWRAQMKGYATCWDRFIYFKVSQWFPQPSGLRSTAALLSMNDGTTIVLAYLLCLLWGARCFVSVIRTYPNPAPRDVIIATLAFTLLYVLLVSSFFERKENMRFRVEVEPLMIIMICSGLTSLADRVALAWRKRVGVFKRR